MPPRTTLRFRFLPRVKGSGVSEEDQYTDSGKDFQSLSALIVTAEYSTL
jgi:hypothetical protein